MKNKQTTDDRPRPRLALPKAAVFTLAVAATVTASAWSAYACSCTIGSATCYGTVCQNDGYACQCT
jgi:hypothetical protein